MPLDAVLLPAVLCAVSSVADFNKPVVHRRVALLAPTVPFVRGSIGGPWEKQAAYLAGGLTMLGQKVIWVPIEHNLSPRNYTAAALAAHIGVKLEPGYGSPYLEKILLELEYHGLPRNMDQRVHFTTVNRFVRRKQIDVVVLLFDVDVLVARTADAAPACTTIAWHLTATRTLSPASRRTLARFTHVVSSSYSGSEVVEEALKAEGIKDPNVWEGPAMVPDVRSRKLLGRDCNEKCWRGVKRRMRVQRQLFPPKLVQDASGKAVGWDGDENFVVLLLLGRHEGTEDIARKGLENALLAFRKLRDVRENAFLFVHAPAAQFKWAREHAPDGSGETYLRKAVDDALIKQFTELVEYVGLRNGSYRFDFTNMAESHQGEILAASDVLLHPMLADGWALPIIEAQLVGTPVVSTSFMAMEDFADNGVNIGTIRYNATADEDYLDAGEDVWVAHTGGVRSHLAEPGTGASPPPLSYGFGVRPTLEDIYDALKEVSDGDFWDTTREGDAREAAENIRDCCLAPTPASATKDKRDRIGPVVQTFASLIVRSPRFSEDAERRREDAELGADDPSILDDHFADDFVLKSKDKVLQEAERAAAQQHAFTPEQREAEKNRIVALRADDSCEARGACLPPMPGAGTWEKLELDESGTDATFGWTGKSASDHVPGLDPGEWLHVQSSHFTMEAKTLTSLLEHLSGDGDLSIMGSSDDGSALTLTGTLSENEIEKKRRLFSMSRAGDMLQGVDVVIVPASRFAENDVLHRARGFPLDAELAGGIVDPELVFLVRRASLRQEYLRITYGMRGKAGDTPKVSVHELLLSLSRKDNTRLATTPPLSHETPTAREDAANHRARWQSHMHDLAPVVGGRWLAAGKRAPEALVDESVRDTYAPPALDPRLPLDKAHASAFAPFAATKELYGQPIKTQKQPPQRQKGDEGWKDRLNRRKEAVAASGATAAARNGIWQKDEAAVAAANEQLQRLNDNKAEASATQPPQVKTPSGEAMKRLNMWNAKTGSSEAVDLADEAAVADLLASSGGVGDTEVDLIVQAMEDPIQKEAASQLAKGAERALREPDAHTNSNSNWIGRLHARLASMLGDSTEAAPEAPKATSEAAAADDDDTVPPLVYGELEEDEELEDYQWDEYEVRGAAASVGGGDWDAPAATVGPCHWAARSRWEVVWRRRLRPTTTGRRRRRRPWRLRSL